eukprot:Phypoly_transcript_14637.p1 GENE.Phypoly_transcript_14637~~Phypoly_transcript_14637.p1  ORF type:complete len:251 (+),score=49.68 Phypoly_transcript_14637:95-847(+)
MGNCPCCPKKGGNYNPYVEEDDENYREYDSPNSRGYKKPLVNNNASNTQTSHYPHSNRPPDESTYIPPPLPPSRGTSLSQDQPQHSTPPNSTPPPRKPTHPPPQRPQQQYTQYSESLYLARQPEQPTDSMLLDSMMKSSFLEKRQQRFPSPPSTSQFGTESSAASGDFDGSSSLVDSGYGSNSIATSASTAHGPDFAASTQSFAASTQTAHLEESVSSTSSSVYYDAQGGTSYMMGSVDGGAFEPPQQHQ